MRAINFVQTTTTSSPFYYFTPFFLCCLFVAITQDHCAQANRGVIQAPMTFEEDQPANTFVGLITNAVQWRQEFGTSSTNSGNKQDELTFSLLTKTRVTFYFDVNPRTGGVFSRVKIDRDALCGSAELCCDEQMQRGSGGIMQCSLDFKVKALTTSNQLTLVDVKIFLVDRNDNVPRWQPNFVFRHILETTEINQIIDLPLAMDIDSGKNGIVLYRLKNRNQVDAFMLKSVREDTAVGESIVKLQLVSTTALNREEKASHEFIVIAEDGGGKTAELIVNVTIDDVNDNAPIFSNGSVFYIKVSENTPQHRQLLKLHATDSDKGENARVSYKLGSTVKSDTIRVVSGIRDHLRHTFAVDAEQGWLILTGKLNFEEHHRLQVPIIAYDNGQPQLSSSALVNIDILDVNDEKPYIEVHPIKDTRVSVPENQQTTNQGTLATISVRDKDSESNGKVDCHLQEGGSDFLLSPLFTEKVAKEPNYYSLRATTSFDRERQSVYSLAVICIDNGSPPQTAMARFDVYITDENDCPPIFKPTSVYLFHIRENLPANTLIGQIRATDEDINVNGEVVYHLMASENSDFVQIDTNTGSLFCKRSFDREREQTYVFHVLATDRGLTNTFTATATITLNIDDVNDNSPNFSASTPTRVEIPESLGLRTNEKFPASKQHQGQRFKQNVPFLTLNATDADIGDNGQVTFVLRHTMILASGDFASKQLFTLQKKSISVRPGLLDREKVSQYMMVIEAVDHGQPSRTSTLSLTVIVADENDNEPRFIWPTDEARELNITSDIVTGSNVGKVHAVDDDLGPNGQVIYTLKQIHNSDDNTFFDIDPKSGNLCVIKALDHSKRRNFRLRVEASDLGTPALTRSQDFLVRVIPPTKQNRAGRNGANQIEGSNAHEANNDNTVENDGKSMDAREKRGIPNIIVILVAGLTILLLIIILSVIYLFGRRRRPRLQAQAKNNRNEKALPPSYDIIAAQRHFSSSSSPTLQASYVSVGEQNLLSSHLGNFQDNNLLSTPECDNMMLYRTIRQSNDVNKDTMWCAGSIKNREFNSPESLSLLKLPLATDYTSFLDNNQKNKKELESQLSIRRPITKLCSELNVSDKCIKEVSMTQINNVGLGEPKAEQLASSNNDYSSIPLHVVGSNAKVNPPNLWPAPAYTILKSVTSQPHHTDEYADYASHDKNGCLMKVVAQCDEAGFVGTGITMVRNMKYPYDNVSNV